MSYVRIGVAGPVGSGKTALIERLTRKMADEYSICVVTNDIYTKEDAEFLIEHSRLAPDRIVGVETGGCPHTAIREDCSMNLEACEEMARTHPDVQIMFVESGGDNLSATFSPDLADATIYVIATDEGDKIPRKGGPGVTRSGRPGPVGSRRSRRDGPRLQEDARRPPVHLHRPDGRCRSGRRHRMDQEERAVRGHVMFWPARIQKRTGRNIPLHQVRHNCPCHRQAPIIRRQRFVHGQ